MIVHVLGLLAGGGPAVEASAQAAQAVPEGVSAQGLPVPGIGLPGDDLAGPAFQGREALVAGRERARFDSGTVNFDRARFERRVSFDGARFGCCRVAFTNSAFGPGKVTFAEADFADGVVTFSRTEFGPGFVHFRNAKFGGTLVDFGNASFNSCNLRFDPPAPGTPSRRTPTPPPHDPRLAWPRARAVREDPARASCGDFVGILVRAGVICAMEITLFLHHCR
jgi:hypothetical protein